MTFRIVPGYDVMLLLQDPGQLIFNRGQMLGSRMLFPGLDYDDDQLLYTVYTLVPVRIKQISTKRKQCNMFNDGSVNDCVKRLVCELLLLQWTEV